MSNIPQGTKFHGVGPSVETINKGSATANALRDAYSIDDMVNYFGTRGLFTQIEHGPVVENTTDELTIIGNGLGSLSVPTNGFARGNTFRVYMEGSLSSLNNAELTINIRDNGNVLATTGAMTLVETSGNLYYMNTTFDTTTDSILNITAQWGAASASNSIDTHVLTLQRVF